MRIIKAAVALLSLTLVSALQAGEWMDLFNGKDIDGWTRVGGEASYEVEEGAIVGTTKPNTPNTFLCPAKEYGDFELTFEVKCDKALNSGVQIRSVNSVDRIPDALADKEKKKMKGRVSSGSLSGPQVEIAANGNAGGMWFEAVGGWLLQPNPKLVKEVYKVDGWNKYRIIAKGKSVKISINDKVINDGEDTRTNLLKGKLGFQVHGVGKREEPLQVRWRNIKIREL
jgi:hypothetical protein